MGHDRGMTVRWGVAGPGPVAGKVLPDLVHVPDAVLTAVGSRSAGRAAAFAAAHAATAGRFAMEAMWTRFCPAVTRLRELVDDEAIGEVRTVTADLGPEGGRRPRRTAMNAGPRGS